MRFGIIGSGSWATAIAKILTDNQQTINWWIRNENLIRHLESQGHNPQYLRPVHFDTSKLKPSSNLQQVIRDSGCLIIAVPSAYIEKSLKTCDSIFSTENKSCRPSKEFFPEEICY